MDILPYVDFIFLNEEELDQLFKIFYNNIQFSDEDNSTNNKAKDYNYFIKEFFSVLDKKNKNKQRLVIITRGSNTTIIYQQIYKDNSIYNKIHYIPILKIPYKDIVDTNGAGDCFSGGFLSGIMMGYDIQTSAMFGNIMASNVLQLSGFQIPYINIIEKYNKIKMNSLKK